MKFSLIACTLAGILILSLTLFQGSSALAKGCTVEACHEGISSIVPESLPMMQLIRMNGLKHGDPDGCVICHGGSPSQRKKKKAHKGIPRTLKQTIGPKAFYPDPGSIWIAENTCGQCHPGYVYRTRRSLMNTEAGKIQGNLHTWGLDEVKGYKVPWGNYEIADHDGRVPSGTTPEYEAYMEEMMEMYPKQFPESLAQLPNPTVKEIEKDPRLAGITYQRQECQRCHIGVRGREERGDYRGMGCSACHMVYSNDGYYEGEDKSIDPAEPGHILKHRIAGNRKTGGIPVESCNACHNRGKRIGVSYQGLMEASYATPFGQNGMTQPKLHTRNYLFVSDDLHHRAGKGKDGSQGGALLCQDCHTSVDVHGDGNIHGTTLGQVEIECSDCHGTPEKFPWELPLGYGDEFGRAIPDLKARGVTDKRLLSGQQFGYAYEKEDGFLLSARGNPLGNVVRKGSKVILHSASGKDFNVPVLKNIDVGKSWKKPAAKASMVDVPMHMKKMECYTCHASWAPQCYGCHVRVDYSKTNGGRQNRRTDWVASGSKNDKNGQTAESRLGSDGILSQGSVFEAPSYLRWEDPILGINGEGRVSPLIPGCQLVYTAIGSNGEILVGNQMPDNPGEGKELEQAHVPLAIDMSPVQPHTIQYKARSCENCHVNPKAVGLGIGSGYSGSGWNADIVVDLKDTKRGELIPGRYQVQIPALPKLDFDWSQIVNKEGRQLSTVGTHWPLSRAFNKKELDKIMKEWRGRSRKPSGD